MNVTFQSGIATKHNTSVPKESATKQKTRRSKRLVVDRIVGGKIMRPEDGSFFKEKLRKNPSNTIEETSPQNSDEEIKAPIKGALTQVLGKSSHKNLKALRSMSKEMLIDQSLQKIVI